MARTLEVKIVGDSSSLERAFAKANRSTAQFQRNTAKASKSTGFLKDFGKGAGISASIVGIATLGEAVHATFEEMANAQKVAAQTNAVLKSTGQVAGVTAQHVDDLALALLNKSGVDDEVIKSGENVLLTFTNIRNEAGKAGDIFDQATRAALDFSVRTGRSMDAASLAIGRALQDPAKAANALRRAQVVLTEAEQHAISVALKQGNTLKAQQLILQDLRKRYEGAAEAAGNTLPGKMNILRERSLNLAAALVQKLIPALGDTVQGLNDVVGAAEKVDNASKKLGGSQGGLGHMLRFLNKPIWRQAIDQFTQAGKVLGIIDENADKATGSIKGLGDAFSATALLTQGLKPGTFSDLPGVTPFQGHPVNITNEQRNQFRDKRLARMIDRVQDIPTLQGQIKRLREIAALVQKWIDAAKDVTRKQTLQDDLLQIQRDILSDQGQLADDAARAADAAKQKQQDALNAMIAALEFNVEKAGATATLNDDIAALKALIRGIQERMKLEGQTTDLLQQEFEAQQQIKDLRRQKELAREFGLLGLGATGDDPIPGLKALRRQFANISQAIAGTKIDTKANRALLDRIRKTLNLKSLEPEVRQKIRDLLNAVQDELKKGGDSIKTKFRAVDSGSFIRSLGLDLSPSDRARLQQALAGRVGRGGGLTVPGTPSAAFAGQGVVINGPVTINGVQDVKSMEHALTKRTKARSHVRRGAR
jgi:hypothetical protein